MAKQDEEAPPKADDGELDGPSSGGQLLELVEKDLRLLAKHWIGVLRDYAYLMLPKQYHSQLPSDGGTFYRFNNFLFSISIFLELELDVILYLIERTFTNRCRTYLKG